MPIHELYMNRCLQLASYGAGYVSPNPMVGAVLVYNERIIGEGWHKFYGESHAEINCIDSVLEADKPHIPMSTLYVSLEPCAHYGKTPPCANRIVAEGITHVVIGSPDPFPEVAGRGVAILKQAGVKTVIGILEANCRFQNRRFFTFHEQKRPYIHLKWAQTADGFMSGKDQERLQITGPLTNRLVHKWRSEEAAIMVGAHTAAVDNPQLTNRLWHGVQPMRIVVDPHLRLSNALNLFTGAGGRTIVLNEVRSNQIADKRVEADKKLTETLAIQSNAETVEWVKVDGLSNHDPTIIVEALYALNIQSVLIEGGALFLNSFLRAGLWDEAHIITNTKLFVEGNVKAPDKLVGTLKEQVLLDNDFIEWVLK